MSDEALADFIAITAAPYDQAKIFLEMAGGNVELAVNIFLQNSDGPQDVAMQPTAAPAQRTLQPPPPPPAFDPPSRSSCSWWGLVWPKMEEPPEAWRLQRLDNASCELPCGILQPKNGPCGVLSVVHAFLLVDQHKKEPEDIKVSREAVLDIICGIIDRSRPDQCAPFRLVRPKRPGLYGPAVAYEITELQDLTATKAEVHARGFEMAGPGGVLDLLHSVVLTRGEELIKKEVREFGGELPLVAEQHGAWLCTTELMGLLMRGAACANVGAFLANGSRNSFWDGMPFGLLSKDEQQSGIPVAEGLKTPSSPVWIIHGGDHFTVAWSKQAPAATRGARFTLFHWNGLPPGGPRLAELSIVAVKGALTGGPEKPKFYKPEPGEVEEFIQADPEDKKDLPDKFRQWRFEVVLARDDPDVQGEPRPPHFPAQPKFNQEDPRYQRPGPWRCRLCYARRYQTCDFALVEGSADYCPKCKKPRKECGWSLWVPFADLPASMQQKIRLQFSKKLESILWTKWPDATVESSHGPLPDC